MFRIKTKMTVRYEDHCLLSFKTNHIQCTALTKAEQTVTTFIEIFQKDLDKGAFSSTSVIRVCHSLNSLVNKSFHCAIAKLLKPNSTSTLATKSLHFEMGSSDWPCEDLISLWSWPTSQWLRTLQVQLRGPVSQRLTVQSLSIYE